MLRRARNRIRPDIAPRGGRCSASPSLSEAGVLHRISTPVENTVPLGNERAIEEIDIAILSIFDAGVFATGHLQFAE